MKCIVGGRRSGKTTKALIHMIDNPDVVLVVYSDQERNNVLDTIKNIGLHIDPSRIVKYSKLIGLGSSDKLLFDNIELYIDQIVKDHPARFGDILNAIFVSKIEGYTITKEDQ